jgi:hypothetical protein
MKKSRYMPRWQVSDSEKTESTAIEVGKAYIRGDCTIAQVYEYLNTQHYPLTRSEIERAIRGGANAEIEFGTPLASRMQPEQLSCPYDWRKVKRQLNRR